MLLKQILAVSIFATLPFTASIALVKIKVDIEKFTSYSGSIKTKNSEGKIVGFVLNGVKHIHPGIYEIKGRYWTLVNGKVETFHCLPNGSTEDKKYTFEDNETYDVTLSVNSQQNGCKLDILKL